jgi:membrane protease YdiL (CAAX protease family)
MSPVEAMGRPDTAVSARWAGLVVALLGIVALALRPVSPVAGIVPVAVGAAAVAVPHPAGRRSSAGVWLVAVLAGVGAVAVASPAGTLPALGVSPAAVLATLAAAVGEEALFRRLGFAYLLRWGAAIAVVGSAVAFALVHLPAYGPMAVWTNLGAGVLFGWQRWVTGGWSAPAVTHGAANLLAAGWLG